jgi:glycosyltransferase involved in cell wall biosynthesis
VKRLIKDTRHRLLPGGMADRVLAVSDFVALRKVEVDLVPARRVTRIWNSVDVPERVPDDGERGRIRGRFGLSTTRPLVICVGRAAREKGIHHLFRAFDALLDEAEFAAEEARPVLLYLGDGPAMREIRALRHELAHVEDIRLGGYVEGAAEIVGAADLAVVPSTWAEAFGLAALEPLSRGVPVVASNVGGLPEVVRHGVDGLLVPPGDEVGLARALYKLLLDPELRQEMGARGRERAQSEFSRRVQLDHLEEVFVSEMFG